MAEIFTTLVTTFEQRLLRRSHVRQVELKVALVTIFLTLFILLPLLSLIVKVRHANWTYIDSFYFTFITLSTIGFGDLLPHFDNDADYVLVLLAFVGLAFVSSIFFSMNAVLEQYGVSVRVVRSLREKSAVKSTYEENTVADEDAVLDLSSKDKTTCDTNGLQDGALSRKDTEIAKDIELEVKPLANRNSLIIEEENRVATSRKRGSSISLGIIRC